MTVPCSNLAYLTAETRMRILALVADTEATGTGIPKASGEMAARIDAAFFASGVCSSMGGAGQGPQGHRCLPGIPTCSVAAHPDGNREAVSSMNRSKHTMNTNSLVFQNTTFDVVDHNGDTWLRSPQIAVALGYSRADRVNELYARNSDEFTDDMTALVKLPTEGGEQEVRIFSPRGCYALAMFARTKTAKAFRVWVMDVLEAIRKTGQYIAQPYAVNPGDKLTAEQADTLRQLLTGAVKKLPKEKQAGAMIQGWSKLKAHFKVSYRDIPQGDYIEAISILSRHVIEGEYLPKVTVDAETEPKKITQPVISDYLQLHINRKTHEVALGQYDAIRGIITEAVQGNLNCGASEATAHDYVDSYGDAASEVIVMNKRDVFMLASQTTELLNSAGQALETIHRLEKHLGRELYQRKKHGEFGCYGLPESLVESVISAAQERKAA